MSYGFGFLLFGSALWNLELKWLKLVVLMGHVYILVGVLEFKPSMLIILTDILSDYLMQYWFGKFTTPILFKTLRHKIAIQMLF